MDAVTKYQAALPPHRAHEAHSLQHVVDVVHKLSEDLLLQYGQYFTQISVDDEYTVALLLRWLRDHNLRHLYKRKDTTKLLSGKKTSTSGSNGSSAAMVAASKHKAVFMVGDQQMELIPVASSPAAGQQQGGDGGTPTAASSNDSSDNKETTKKRLQTATRRAHSPLRQQHLRLRLPMGRYSFTETTNRRHSG